MAPAASNSPLPVPGSPLDASRSRLPGYSFCLITNGKRPAKLQIEIDSIRALDIPGFEIILGGEPPPGLANVRRVPAVDAARNGRLGEMRNRVVACAQYDHVVVADDDLVFQPGFYEGLQRFGEDYGILCVRFLNLDGSRYWDWATAGGPRGHALLDYEQTDPHVYVTGGLCIMKAEVATRVKWNQTLGFYQSEDLDFSRRVHAAGIPIRFNPWCTVVHNDPRYTRLDQVVVGADVLERLAEENRRAGNGPAAQYYRDRLGFMARCGERFQQNSRVSPSQSSDLPPIHTRSSSADPTPAAVQGSSVSTSTQSFERRSSEVESARVAPPAPTRLERGQASLALTLPVRWYAPIYNPSGYASEALNFIVPLAEKLNLGIFHHTTLYSEQFAASLSDAERALLTRLERNCTRLSGGIVVSHNPAHGFALIEDAAWHIGRTMFETDRIPAAWVSRCNQMDEVWVPSHFNVQTFAASGVERDKLVVIPGAVDEQRFDPGKHAPLALPNAARFNFLSVFEWTTRKGWDVLLSAYLREFTAEDDVCLYLRTYLFGKPDGDPQQVITQMIRDYAAQLNLSSRPQPRIELLLDQVAGADLPRLYRAVDCLVAPSRGEGWGRPQHEAMMMGLPVIATPWSGTTEFMTPDTAYLLEYKLAEVSEVDLPLRIYRGHRWANPSEKHLRQLMRQVQQDPVAARARGVQARAFVLQNYSRGPVAQRVFDRLLAIERKLTTPALPAVVARAAATAKPGGSDWPLKVTWEGSFSDAGSLSHVNRELISQLITQTKLQVSCVEVSSSGSPGCGGVGAWAGAGWIRANAPAEAHFTVRHAWPPKWDRPAHGAWVLIQPWEFGLLPVAWIKPLGKVDEIWAYSEFVRREYVDSGIDPTKVKVVPLGIDPDRFKPEAVRLKLPTTKRFKFLFVGGTIARKGPDVLLKAYLETFTDADDVCLVIKDFGGQSVYAGQTLETQIRAAQQKPGGPQMIYLDQALPADALPGLYTACDCLVHPYRGEGFGLPVLEAMAAGLPVVVTAGGATDDFATDEFAYRLPSVRRSIGATVGGFKLLRHGWLLEPDLAALKERLRWIVDHPEEARAKGRAASQHVRRDWTWKRSAKVAAARLNDLAGQFAAEATAAAELRKRQMVTIELPPAARIGQLNHARALLTEKRFVDAWTATIEATRRRPFHPEAILLLAEIALAAGDFARARCCAERAARLAPHWPALRKLAGCLPQSGQPTTVAWPGGGEIAGQGRGEPRLSVCLITKNEEKFLGQCLHSVADLAQQIVVMDTGSTDRTLEIAKRFHAEIYSFAWCDDFSAARNAALEHVTGDWVLILDADEELMPASREKLLREIRNPLAMGYRLPIVDEGKEDEGCSYVPRLFRNAPALFFVGRIHEQVFSSLEVRRQEWGLECKLGETTLLHHGYTTSLTRDRNKAERNLRLLERAIRELPEEPNLLMSYGLELCRCGLADEGLENYARAFQAMTRQPARQVVPELRETLLMQFSSQLMARKDFDEIVRLLTSPLAQGDGASASIHFALGLAYLHQQQFSQAVEQFRQCLAKRHLPALCSINREIRKAGPNHCLALGLVNLKRYPEAETAFKAALAEDPDSWVTRFDYARFLADRARFVEALEQLHKLAVAKPSEASVWQFGAQIALSQPEFLEFARDWTATALETLPQVPILQQQRAEALLLSQQATQALPLWRELAAAPSASLLAALIICELLAEGRISSVAGPLGPALEVEISREFLKWYQRLSRFGATALLTKLNTEAPKLALWLPSASKTLQAALAQARR